MLDPLCKINYSQNKCFIDSCDNITDLSNLLENKALLWKVAQESYDYLNVLVKMWAIHCI